MDLSSLSGDIQQYIANASAQFGVSSSYLSTVAQIESGGNPNAAGGGLYQIQPGTASGLGITNVFDPQQNTNGAAQIAATNYNGLSTFFGSAPQDWQLYIAHQQGLSGAMNLFGGDPNAPASAYGTNIAGNLGSDFQTQYGTSPQDATVGQFLSYWQNKYNGISGQGTAGASGTGASGAGASGAGASGAGASGTTPASSGTGSQSWSGWASHWIVRIFIFLLGLIFVAAGLFMFSRTGKLAIEVAGENRARRIGNYFVKPASPPTQTIKSVGGNNQNVQGEIDKLKRSYNDLVGEFVRKGAKHSAKQRLGRGIEKT